MKKRPALVLQLSVQQSRDLHNLLCDAGNFWEDQKAEECFSSKQQCNAMLNKVSEFLDLVPYIPKKKRIKV